MVQRENSEEYIVFKGWRRKEESWESKENSSVQRNWRVGVGQKFGNKMAIDFCVYILKRIKNKKMGLSLPICQSRCFSVD